MSIGCSRLAGRVIVAIYYLIYMQVEAYVISPTIMKRAVKVPGVVVVVAALAGGTLLGILGASSPSRSLPRSCSSSSRSSFRGRTNFSGASIRAVHYSTAGRTTGSPTASHSTMPPTML